jgi:hypothetical protein
MAQSETEFSPSSYPVPARLPNVRGSVMQEITELEVADTTSLLKLGNALKTADSGYYTDARLDSMTKNDMRYALRVHAGIDSKGP